MATPLEIPIPEITRGDFDRSWTRFSLVAAAKEWDDAKQLTIIPTLLKGKLLDHYIELTDVEKASMADLKKNLTSKAGLTKNKLTAARDFQSRIQGTTEAAGEYASDLKKKFKQAFPEEATTSAVLLQKFLTGLRPTTSCQVMLKGEPQTFEDAIKVAKDVENALEFNREMREDGEPKEILSIDKTQQLQDTVERLAKTIEGMTKKIEKLEMRERQVRVDTRKCYRCGEIGHIRSRCPLNSQGPARKVTGGWPQNN